MYGFLTYVNCTALLYSMASPLRADRRLNINLLGGAMRYAAVVPGSGLLVVRELSFDQVFFFQLQVARQTQEVAFFSVPWRTIYDRWRLERGSLKGVLADTFVGNALLVAALHPLGG